MSYGTAMIVSLKIHLLVLSHVITVNTVVSNPDTPITGACMTVEHEIWFGLYCCGCDQVFFVFFPPAPPSLPSIFTATSLDIEHLQCRNSLSKSMLFNFNPRPAK